MLLVQQHLGVSREPVSESLPVHLRCGRVCVLLALCFFCFCRGRSFIQPVFGGIYQRPAVLGTGTHSVVLIPGELAELQSRDLGGEGRGSRGGRRRPSWVDWGKEDLDKVQPLPGVSAGAGLPPRTWQCQSLLMFVTTGGWGCCSHLMGRGQGAGYTLQLIRVAPQDRGLSSQTVPSAEVGKT